MQRRLLPAVCLALVAPTLSACGLFGGGGHLSDALDVTPATASQVQFFDRERAAERLDILDADVETYLEAITDTEGRETYTGTPIVRLLLPMADAAIDERDIDWSISGFLPDGEQDGAYFAIYKVDDDVDLDDVAADMVDAGYADEKKGKRRHLTIDLEQADPTDSTYGGRYPAEWTQVWLIPQEHLLITGSALDEVLAVVDDDADSLTDADTFDDLLDGVDDVETAILEQDGCEIGGPTPTSALEQGFELGRPTQAAYLATGDELATSARLRFGDDDAAEADAKAREEFLADGASVLTGLPNSELGSFEVDADGSLVVVSIDGAGRPAKMFTEHDAFAACGEAD